MIAYLPHCRTCTCGRALGDCEDTAPGAVVVVNREKLVEFVAEALYLAFAVEVSEHLHLQPDEKQRRWRQQAEAVVSSTAFQVGP